MACDFCSDPGALRCRHPGGTDGGNGSDSAGGIGGDGADKGFDIGNVDFAPGGGPEFLDKLLRRPEEEIPVGPDKGAVRGNKSHVEHGAFGDEVTGDEDRVVGIHLALRVPLGIKVTVLDLGKLSRKGIKVAGDRGRGWSGARVDSVGIRVAGHAVGVGFAQRGNSVDKPRGQRATIERTVTEGEPGEMIGQAADPPAGEDIKRGEVAFHLLLPLLVKPGNDNR